MDTMKTETTTTCTSIVERRSGYGWTTGAGDQAGAYTALCGKTTVDGSSMCRRHLNAQIKLEAALELKRARIAARQAKKEMN